MWPTGRSPDSHERALPLLLVGYGQRGRRWHDVIDSSKRAEVVGAVDVERTSRRAAERRGVAAAASIEEWLKAGTAAAAIVASPPRFHPEHAQACAAAGLGVLVEKPLAPSLDEARSMVEAAHDSPLLVGQNFRYLRRERIVRRLLEQDAIGSVRYVNIFSARTRDAAPRHLDDIEHGAVWDACVHHLDALLTRFDTEAATVDARARAIDGGIGATAYSMTIELRDGPVVKYEHREGASAYWYTEWIEGWDAAIAVDHQRVALLSSTRRPTVVGKAHLFPDRFRPSPDAPVLEELLRVMGGEPSSLDARSGLRTIALLEAVVESLHRGAAVDVARGYGSP